MAKTLTTSGRSIKLLREMGYTAESVERFFGGFRHDLFNGIDIIAIKGDETLGVQTTTVNCGPAHLEKLKELSEMKLWLLGRNRSLQLWTWSRYRVKRELAPPKVYKRKIKKKNRAKQKPRFTKDVEWRVNISELILDIFGQIVVGESLRAVG